MNTKATNPRLSTKVRYPIFLSSLEKINPDKALLVKMVIDMRYAISDAMCLVSRTSPYKIVINNEIPLSMDE